jgi:hypothetical protein
MTPYELRFHDLSEWARGEMAKLGYASREKQIGQLWLIVDELMRRIASAETQPPVESEAPTTPSRRTAIPAWRA